VVYRSKEHIFMTTIEISDARYPEPLRNIPDPPTVLYVDGELESTDALAVAIVGSRHATLYGIRVARMLAEELSLLGFTIVSGMARGIDRVAHEGALAAGGRTLAVLGCGLDVAYPSDHTELRAQVAAAGAVLTELPLGSPPLAAHFPRRNRILSGLSLGVVVVEAAEGSGSLITAKLAAEQGREVFAVPGHIDAPTSRGTHALLKQGAKLTETVDDILEELVPQIQRQTCDTAAAGSSSNDGVHAFARPEARSARRIATHPTGTARTEIDLSSDELKVYAAVAREPRTIDEVTDQSALTSSTVTCALLALELKDAIRQTAGRRYYRSR
jgi:DNA processing protein